MKHCRSWEVEWNRYHTSHKKVNVLCPFDGYRYRLAMGTGTSMASAILPERSQSKMAVFVLRDDSEC